MDTKQLIIGAVAVALILYLCNSYESFNSSAKQVLFFSMSGCGHCQNFKRTWQQLLNKYAQDNGFELVEVNVDSNPQKVQQYNIPGFPTILVEENGKVKQEYQGDRSFGSVVNFIESFR